MQRMIFILEFIFGAFLISMAQTKGVQFDETATVSKLDDYFLQYNMRRTDFPGWRIQVFVTTDRREMENTLSSFRSRFPGYGAKWILNDPYYQIRAGFFIDYAEAMRALTDIRRGFKSATLITDRIRREEAINL